MALTPRIYIGTYNAYNNGSLHGAWIDLEECGDAETFWAKIHEVHAKELAERGEIEPMFQDWEDIPDRFISESSLSTDVWDEWVALDDDDRELLEVYLDHIDQSGTLEQAQEAFAGKFSSEADWAEQFWEDAGYISEVPESLRFYIDYEKYARDCRLNGDVNFVEHEGDVWVFNNH